jgi:hypothetical protein
MNTNKHEYLKLFHVYSWLIKNIASLSAFLRKAISRYKIIRVIFNAKPQSCKDFNVGFNNGRDSFRKFDLKSFASLRLRAFALKNK